KFSVSTNHGEADCGRRAGAGCRTAACRRAIRRHQGGLVRPCPHPRVGGPAAHHDRSIAWRATQMSDTPVIGITMGDGAGIGPEVVVKAFAEAEVRQICRPVVLGDSARLNLAAGICGLDVDVNTLETTGLATFETWAR